MKNPTLPEAIAYYQSNGDSPSTKKGLLVAPDKIQSDEIDDLGVKHAAQRDESFPGKKPIRRLV